MNVCILRAEVSLVFQSLIYYVLRTVSQPHWITAEKLIYLSIYRSIYLDIGIDIQIYKITKIVRAL